MSKSFQGFSIRSSTERGREGEWGRGGERVNGGGGVGERLRGTAPVSKMVSTGIALFMWSLPLRLTKLRAALILFVKHGCAIFGVLRYFL